MWNNKDKFNKHTIHIISQISAKKSLHTLQRTQQFCFFYCGSLLIGSVGNYVRIVRVCCSKIVHFSPANIFDRFGPSPVCVNAKRSRDEASQRFKHKHEKHSRSDFADNVFTLTFYLDKSFGYLIVMWHFRFG